MAPGIDMMIDLETAGPAPDGAIVSIGWCVFRRIGLVPDTVGCEVWPTTEEYGRIPVNVQSCLDIGMRMDEQTIREFWLKQSAEVRSLWTPSARHIKTALQDLSAVFLYHGCKRIWAYPSTFDVSILDRAYQLAGVTMPWLRKDYMCARSVMEGAGFRRDKVVIPPAFRVEHLPEMDAIRQTIQLRECLNFRTQCPPSQPSSPTCPSPPTQE